MRHFSGNRLLLFFLMLAILSVGSTAAFLIGFDGKKNTVAVGRNTTSIVEEFPTPSPVPLKENPEYKKTVWVQNKSSGETGYEVDCYVRVMLSFSDAELGKAVPLLG